MIEKNSNVIGPDGKAYTVRKVLANGYASVKPHVPVKRRGTGRISIGKRTIKPSLLREV